MHLWVTLTQWPLYSTSLARIALAKSWFLHSDRWTDRPLGLVSPWLPNRRLMFPVSPKPVLWLKVLGTSAWTGIRGRQTSTSSELLVTFNHRIQHLEPCRLSPTGFSFRYRHTCWLMHLPLTWYLWEPSAQCPGDWEQILIYSFFSPQGTKPARASLLSALCSTDPGRRFPADPEEAATAPAASHRKHCAVLWQATPQCQVISHLKPGMTRVIKSGEHNRWMRLSSN